MEKALVYADTQRLVGVWVARFLFAEKALEPRPRRHLQRGTDKRREKKYEQLFQWNKNIKGKRRP